MLTLPEGSYRNPDLLRPEQRQAIESDIKACAQRMMENFISFVQEKHPVIYPFATMLFQEGNELAVAALPIMQQLPAPALAGLLHEAVTRGKGLALAFCFDGRAQHRDLRTGQPISEKKDAIISCWMTAWGPRSLTVTRYGKSEFGLQFERPVESPEILGSFEGIFPSRGQRH